MNGGAAGPTPFDSNSTEFAAMQKPKSSGQLRPHSAISFSLGKLGWLPRIALLALGLFPPALLPAAQLQQALVSQVIKDVKLLPPQAAPRPARVSDEVRDGTAVRTGL